MLLNWEERIVVFFLVMAIAVELMLCYFFYRQCIWLVYSGRKCMLQPNYYTDSILLVFFHRCQNPNSIAIT